MTENSNLEATIKANKERYGEIVRKLYANDNDEWKDIFYKVVLAVTGPNTKLGQIIKDFCLDRNEIFDELYIQMVCKKKKALDTYRYEGNLYQWMRRYVPGIVLKFIKKLCIETVDPQTLESITATMSAESADENEERYKIIEAGIVQLYPDNPQGASLLILHGREGFTFNAICGSPSRPQDKTTINTLNYDYDMALEKLKEITHNLLFS